MPMNHRKIYINSILRKANIVAEHGNFLCILNDSMVAKDVNSSLMSNWLLFSFRMTLPNHECVVNFFSGAIVMTSFPAAI